MGLFPISTTSGYYSTVGRKRSPDTSPEAFEELLRSSRTDDEWGIRANKKRVKRGDLVVVYAAKRAPRPPLLIGFGTIVSKPHDVAGRNRDFIRIRWDKKNSLRLCAWPIDATYLPKHLPQQKGAVVALKPILERWIKLRIAKREAVEQGALAELDSHRTKVKIVQVAGRRYEAVLRHDPKVLAPLRARLRARGWEEFRRRAGGAETDLLAADPGRHTLLIVEAKTNRAGDGRAEIRYAIGQILEYQFLLLPKLVRVAAFGRLERLILLEHRAREDLISFVERLGFGIAWLQGRQIGAGPETRRRLGVLLH